MFTLKLIAQLNLERNCLIHSSSLRSSRLLTSVVGWNFEESKWRSWVRRAREASC